MMNLKEMEKWVQIWKCAKLPGDAAILAEAVAMLRELRDAVSDYMDMPDPSELRDQAGHEVAELIDKLDGQN